MISNAELLSLLKSKNEKDWFDFKLQLNTYNTSTQKWVDSERDELIKDILGLANGNSRIVKKNKYLIIGADDNRFDVDGMRQLQDVDYKVPTQSEITKWVNDSCTPAVVGIETMMVEVKGKRVYVISIPPTFELHETTRDLKNKYHKHTVFMRQDEHTRPASVRDGVTIERLKLQYRQEIINPSAIKLGAAIGGVIGLLYYNSGLNHIDLTSAKGISVEIIVGASAVILGAEIGYAYREFKSSRYDWPYMSSWKRTKIWMFLLLVLPFVFYIITKKYCKG